MNDADRAQLIHIAANAVAADLTDVEELRHGHGFSADDLALVAALAGKRAAAGNPFAIRPEYSGEGLALAIENAAALIGQRFTTVERLKAACLADRPDADDLAAIIASASRRFGALPPSPPQRAGESLLSADDGGVLPSGDARAAGRAAEPRAGASPSCLIGRHQPGPINEYGHAECLDCGTALVAVLPGGPIYFEGGNAPLNIT